MKRLCLAILLTLVCIFCFASCAEGKYNGELIEIRFLDVGQADAILLRTPEGDVLIDAGSEESQDTLCARLDQLGVKELLLAVFTHADEDHIGGADGILQAFPVREIWFNGSEGDNESAKRLFDCFQEGETEVRAVCEGEILRIGEVSITVLHPFHLISAVGNEDSIVLKVSCGEFDMLLTGDANAFLSVNPLATVLVVLVKGIMCGLVAGVIYALLKRVNSILAVIVAAICCPVVNTGIFLTGCNLFFYGTITEWAALYGYADAASYMLFGLAGVNFLIELGVNILLAPVIVRLIKLGSK